MEEDSHKTPLPKVQEYLKNTFTISAPTYKTQTAIRNLIKWLFEFLRNVMVVGVVIFLGKKTNNVALKWVGATFEGLLFAYLWSYLDPLLIRPFHRIQNPIIEVVLNALVHLLIIATFWWGTIVFLGVLTDDIANGYLK